MDLTEDQALMLAAAAAVTAGLLLLRVMARPPAPSPSRGRQDLRAEREVADFLREMSAWVHSRDS